MIRERFSPDGNDGGEEDYLSRLANSILKKETREPTGVPPGGISQSQMPRRPSPGPGPSRPDPMMTPLPTALPPQYTPLSSQRTPAPPTIPTYAPLGGSDSRTGSRPGSKSDSQTGVPRMAGDWVRRVEMTGPGGEFLPGTILVFEDGMMGVYKERNQRKDYDIVYILDAKGRANPQGIPLENYGVEPVGRLSSSCMELVVSNNRWERDMIIFHLLKYRDRAYVPTITENPHDAEPIANSEHLSQMSVQKLTPAMLQPDYKDEEPEKPALIRGREMTIEFGPGRKWKAIYWGKDELGHVVAHNTHDSWSLMHLDLNRFKDTIVFGNIVGQDVIRQMERDLAKA